MKMCFHDNFRIGNYGIKGANHLDLIILNSKYVPTSSRKYLQEQKICSHLQ
ncbi:hypothetical protein MBAV_000162 [Candidatus Magnetobacterium bavaricum]|uniref:Uncharacterized protein n=1 Tax=Candidatus Magnetobacterium bavaricum TaxID=29290 RepID=A0A0F3H0I3_9BACT|nr:hypothetical protein MBAV_000162 [Candidatus Magnetobacterium bavaricum]